MPFQDAPAAANESATEAMSSVRALALVYGEKILFALAILVLGWFVARLFTSAVRKALARANLDSTLTRFLGNLAHMLAMTFVIIAAISKLGVETASFVAVLGAAGFAVGFWSSRDELVRNWGVERRWHPKMADAERAKLYAAWQKAVQRSFDWVDRSI